MPSDLALKLMNTTHRLILTASGGKLGWNAAGMTVLELTTIGRKSGAERKTMLTAPYQEGDQLIVVASRGGDDHHPAWYLNLRDHPQVQVAVGGHGPRDYQAQILDDQERDRLWPEIASSHTMYAGYQKKTDRVIPLIRLSPASPVKD